MNMDKVIYKKEGIKRIQVNEQGDYIEFDLLDIELPLKVEKTRKELLKQNSIFRNRCKAIEKQYKDNRDLMMTNTYKAELDFCKKCREVLDGLLGEGACQKIFGNTNRYGMFEDYFDQLSEILGNLEIDIEAIKEKLINKYKQSKDVI